MAKCEYCDGRGWVENMIGGTGGAQQGIKDCPVCTKSPVIAGKNLHEWRDFAQRDDCLDRMVPSDLRQLVAAIPFDT